MHLPARFSLLMLAAALLTGSLWAQGNFVYTNNDQDPNTVSAFSAASNGALTPVPGSPFSTGGRGSGAGLFATNRIGAAIAGSFLFVPNSASNDVSVFKIDPATGVLTPVAGSPFATGNHPLFPGNTNGIAVAATPDGRFLMAASNGSANIAVFSIGSNGALSPIAGSPFPTVGNPNAIKISPDGKFLAVSKSNSFVFTPTRLEMFSIASDGSLASVGQFSASSVPAGLDIDCSSSFLYVGEGNGSRTIVDAYSIASDGTLTALPGSPFSPASGINSNVVLLSPGDKTMFVSNQSSNTITALSVASDGSLSLLPASPFLMNGAVAFPAGMATSQDGSLLYVADANPAISVFQVGSNGVLTEAPGSPFPTGRAGGLRSLTAFPPKTCAPPVLAVGIQIKDDDDPPPVRINPRSHGKIPVAILSTLDFNAVTEVDTHSLTFGRTGNEASLAFCNRSGEDVNDDGLADLVCHFNSRPAAFVAGDTTAVLKGKTLNGRQIQGAEAIRTVGDEDSEHHEHTDDRE